MFFQRIFFADEMFDAAADSEVALLVVGDPFGATTHSDLVLRAKRRNIDVRVIHNASIMNAVGFCGLQVIELVDYKNRFAFFMFSMILIFYLRVVKNI